MATREDMTLSRFGRGTCPVCDRPNLRVLKDGTIGRHGSKEKVWPPQNCAGYTDKRKPKEDDDASR